MLKYIFKREMQSILQSRVFLTSFLLVVVLFIIGTISFLKSYDENIQKYSKYQTIFTGELKKTAESNLSNFATDEHKYILKSRDTGFIDDCREKYFPNTFFHNAYNVFGFEVGSGSVNPFLNKFQELNWSFIVSFIISFVVLLLTFDAVSGEKELRTLALTLSNSISRGTLLFGKYVSVIVSTMLMLIVGILLSILIVMIYHLVSISSANLVEISGFVIISFFFISLISAIGILSSVIVKNSNVSLLIALTFWLIFVVAIPNTSVFWTKNIFSIEKRETIDKKISDAKSDINKNAPKGSWGGSDKPFDPRHKLRAANQTNLMNAEMNIRNAYYLDMFRQLEKTRFLTTVSPVSLYEYMNEALVGGGYLRFKKVWNDLHIFQPQFLEFFKTLDAKDSDSPHWYNPYEDYSTTKKSVKFEQVPLFEEKIISLEERFSFILKYLSVIIIYTSIIFFSSFVLFVRYDVR